MIKYLRDNYGNRPSSKLRYDDTIVNANERMELDYLRNEV